MALVSTGSLSKALMPGVNAWFGLSYNEYAQQFKEIFDLHNTDQNFVEDVNVYGTGIASVKKESQNIAYTDFAVAGTVRYTPLVYGLGFILSREAIEDNQYVSLAEKRSKMLARSLAQTKEIVAANVLNRAFNSSYTGVDAVELCSTAHVKARGGTYQNELTTSADLSEASLEQALIDIADLQDDASMRIAVMGRKLIVPSALMFEAARILKSTLQPDVVSNNLNAIKASGMLPDGFTVNNYLTDSDAWFIKTDCPDGLKLFQRRPVEIANESEFDSENMKFKATERYVFGWTDPRGVYGSPGA